MFYLKKEKEVENTKLESEKKQLSRQVSTPSSVSFKTIFFFLIKKEIIKASVNTFKCSYYKS